MWYRQHNAELTSVRCGMVEFSDSMQSVPNNDAAMVFQYSAYTGGVRCHGLLLRVTPGGRRAVLLRHSSQMSVDSGWVAAQPLHM